MTSGFVALDLKKATYPEEAYNYLNSIGYRIDVNANLARDNIPAFFDDLSITFEKRKEAIRHFFQTKDWQIFIGTITETDRLHHFFFHNALNDGEFHEAFIDFYKKLDMFLGKMYEKAMKENALFLTCSDHGFTPIKTEVYLNKWLMEEGYLEITVKEKGIETITETSKAFCLDPSRIYIHLNGKYPRGSVKDSEYQEIRNAPAQKLKTLSFNGEKVVKEVYFKEDIFKGPYAEKGPDIYVLPNYGFDLKGAFNRESVFGTTHFKGMHTHDDAHLFISHKHHNNNSFKIEDIAGIVTKYIH
ncbi:MAG: alkaline phosphatase family protein [Thermodesulfovibrionales bacterium]|nr:alkaline phosphatase family protein [Thermodesulfovibrionales bacterium]